MITHGENTLKCDCFIDSWVCGLDKTVSNLAEDGCANEFLGGVYGDFQNRHMRMPHLLLIHKI
jgi:hypothetical protein